MKKILTEIQDGTFATNWIKENETGPEKVRRNAQQGSLSIPSKRLAASLRAAMPFLDLVTVTVDSPGAGAASG